MGEVGIVAVHYVQMRWFIIPWIAFALLFVGAVDFPGSADET